MGRKKSFSHDAILDAAEAVVAQVGAHKLTLNLVAEKAGISKGGLAYSFKSKEDLISAMTDRELSRFGNEIKKLTGRFSEDRLPQLLAKIAVTRTEDEVMIGKAASLVASLLQAKGSRDPLRQSYREELDMIRNTDDVGRRGRVAFWALEGIFWLRGLGFMEIPAEEWEESLDDIRDMYLGKL